MTSFLQPLFQAIAQAKNEQQLRSHVVETGREYFLAKRCGVFFFDRIFLANTNLQKTMRLALSVDYNPVARYLVERHAPVHDGLLASPKTWRLICPRADHWHVMAGPIVSNGQLVGAVGFTREQIMPAFDSQNLIDLSALCLHLSTWAATAATLRFQPSQKLETDCLTSREVQIAQLVAQGRTNAEIGVELWITENSVKQALKRMFRKLEVSSRAQMTAHFVSTKFLLSSSIEK